MDENLNNNTETKAAVLDPTANTKKKFTVSDFSITELEDRLEMAGRCNGRCDKN
jgi:hypothetical protein